MRTPKSDDGPLRILGIVGSLRRDSYNRSLVEAARELAPSGMEVILADLYDIPLYNADLDNDVDRPAAVEAFKQRIAEAEYNHGIAGVLKNAIDWASRPGGSSPMKDKPAALMGATTGMWGTSRAQDQMRIVLDAIGVWTVKRPLVLVRQAADKFDESGRLVDGTTRKFVADLLVSLYELTERLRISTPAEKQIAVD